MKSIADILKHMSATKSVKQIAEETSLSEFTVREYLKEAKFKEAYAHEKLLQEAFKDSNSIITLLEKAKLYAQHQTSIEQAAKAGDKSRIEAERAKYYKELSADADNDQ